MPCSRTIDFSYLVMLCVLLVHFLASEPIHNCSNNSYEANELFSTYLVMLLGDLQAKASTQPFYSTTLGGLTEERVYGLYQCRGDISPSECQSCLTNATDKIQQSCPNSTEADWWSDNCQLHFSNHNFFGLVNSDGVYLCTNTRNDPPRSQGDKAVEFASNLTKQVPFWPSMFGTAELANESIYSLAQCNMDLSQQGCSTCLQDAMVKVEEHCKGRTSWSYSARSCRAMFDSYRFFKTAGIEKELVGHDCSQDRDPATTLFKRSLYTLLNVLIGNAPTSNFYKSPYGYRSNSVYGLAQCRGDLNKYTCQDCLKKAWGNLKEICPDSTQAILWNEKCFLRYSNKSFFGTMSTRMLFHIDNATAEDSDILGFQFVPIIAEKASKDKKLFAAYKMKVNKLETRYYYADCTRDLGSKPCLRCLKTIMQQVGMSSRGQKGWFYFSPSCRMRYEAYPFFNSIIPSQQPMATPSTQPNPHQASKRGKKRKILIISLVAAILGLVLLCSAFCLLRGKKAIQKERMEKTTKCLLDNSVPLTGSDDIFHTNLQTGDMENQELPMISLEIVQSATDNFSFENKLGEGGFGAVFKGTLEDGMEIAVKRLSRGSWQGVKEFKNEVQLIAKLQHKNLVRLLFCRVEKGEKLLIYEYMPNNSLDFFLFDPTKRAELQWSVRFNIISGIAKGLLYLHEDSRLKIIHRDLKASNVLLDHIMNPKISDFGLARIFLENQGEANTAKVIGTIGYMAPEYAMDGLFSVKSDVFSFGVLLLEIVSGEKNSRSYLIKNARSLPAYAWDLWCKEKIKDLIDPFLIESSPIDAVIRLTHIGLLCIQEKPTDRPTMSDVVVMLRSESMLLPQPNHPPLYNEKRVVASDQSSRIDEASNSNEVSASELQPR